MNNTTLLVLVIIRALLDWLGSIPKGDGEISKEQLDEIDAKWQAAKANWE